MLVSLAYTPHLGDADGTVLMAGDPSVRHDWGLEALDDPLPVPSAWRMPDEDRAGAGWHMTGALLGFDVALGPQALRRVVGDAVPGPPTISDIGLQIVTDAVAGAVPFDHNDGDRDVIVDAIQRGRARVEAARAHPDDWPAVADAAGIRDVRRELLTWTIRHEPERLTEMVSRGDLLRLGRNAGTPLTSLDAWGTSGRVFDGRWSPAVSAAAPWLELAQGRRGTFVAATLIPDLALAVAESLHARACPRS